MGTKRFKSNDHQIKQLVEPIGGCMATDKITVDGEHVYFMYREKPDFINDSGWRFLSETETQEYADNSDNWAIYDVNTIANYDPSIITYLGSPVGTELERIKGTDKFRTVDQCWKEIKENEDIYTLLQLYGNFHDGCLREVHIVTKESVDSGLSMSFNGILTATLLFQRQYKNPTTIELRFENVVQFNFLSPKPDHDAVIYDATFKKMDNLFYWSSEDNWQPGDNDAVWISGERVYWRERPELIGQVNRITNM